MHPLQAEAKAIRKRLFNPPNGRASSELEIESEAVQLARSREQGRAERIREAAKRRDERMAQIIAEAKERAEQYRVAELAWLQRRRAAGIPVGTVIDACCARYGVSAIDIISSRRTKLIADVRHIVMYLCCTLTTRSLPQIGRCLGDRDHTTILHGRNKIKDRVAADPTFAAEIEDIKKSLEVA